MGRHLPGWADAGYPVEESYQGPGKGHCGPRATMSHGETAGHPQAGSGQARRKAAGDLGREQGHMARPLDTRRRSPGFARGRRGSGRRERLSQVGAVGVGSQPGSEAVGTVGDGDTRTAPRAPRTSAALCVQTPRLCAPATEKRALGPPHPGTSPGAVILQRGSDQGSLHRHEVAPWASHGPRARLYPEGRQRQKTRAQLSQNR